MTLSYHYYAYLFFIDFCRKLVVDTATNSHLTRSQIIVSILKILWDIYILIMKIDENL